MTEKSNGSKKRPAVGENRNQKEPKGGFYQNVGMTPLAEARQIRFDYFRWMNTRMDRDFL